MSAESILDLRENIAALAIAVLRKDVFTVEDAFDVLEHGKRKKGNIDTEELIRLRETGMSYPKISEMLGINQTTIWFRVNSCKRKSIQTD